MNRNQRKRIGAETVEIVHRGWYQRRDGERVNIASAVTRCLNATQLYRPAELKNLVAQDLTHDFTTIFSVENDTTLSVAQRLVTEHGHTKTLCLNFASAKSPGGGFLGGSQAQEESLARSSALYASLLTQNTYYDVNRSCTTALYTDHMVLSPDVPVFRNDSAEPLDAPYLLSVLTAPAVNAGAVTKNEPNRVSDIRSTMETRISMVLAVAAHHGYEHLVLGAWGCGVFQNDPEVIAKLFANALLGNGRFGHKFASVTFAVLDNTTNGDIIEPFQRQFAKVCRT